MSYDLTFLIKRAGQSWEEALEALGEDASGSRPNGEAWATVLQQAREMLGDISEQLGEDFYQFEHESTGIELVLYAAEAGITVPYWYKGEDARRIVQTIYKLGRIVEEHTTLTGYDGQIELPLVEAMGRPELAAAIFDQVAASFAQRGISSPSNDN